MCGRVPPREISMPKMSKAAKAEAYGALEVERDLWAQLAWHNVNGHAPDAMQVVEHDGDTYEYRLYGAQRANGGILVTVFRSPGQSASLEVFRFDDWLNTMNKWPFGNFYTEVKISADKLRIEREKLYAKERESA